MRARSSLLFFEYFVSVYSVLEMTLIGRESHLAVETLHSHCILRGPFLNHLAPAWQALFWVISFSNFSLLKITVCARERFTCVLRCIDFAKFFWKLLLRYCFNCMRQERGQGWQARENMKGVVADLRYEDKRCVSQRHVVWGGLTHKIMIKIKILTSRLKTYI